MNRSDEALMLAYQQGEAQAFDHLYRRFAPRVYGYLKKRVPDPTRLEEIFQGVFLKLHQCRDRYNPTLPFVPWLFTICHSVLVDAARAGEAYADPRQEPIEEAESVAAPASPAADWGSDAIPLAALAMPQRQLLELRYVEDLSFEEIARRLRISPVNARQRLSRAVRQLRGLVSSKSGQVKNGSE